jgi:hypothetical protein
MTVAWRIGTHGGRFVIGQTGPEDLQRHHGQRTSSTDLTSALHGMRFRQRPSFNFPLAKS